ncbi:MAG: BolA family protein [Pseudomonadota bacterium]
MVFPEDVKNYIENGLPCDHVAVEGDGHHFEAVIVSPEFRGKTMVQQHQLVYRALGERMREQIHALSMKTYTPEEWAEQG